MWRNRVNDYNHDYHYRVITNQKILQRNKEINKNYSIVDIMVNSISQPIEQDIIFFIHGGGFLSQSTESHASYLRT
jgi:acetyl esterase/lipase